MERVGVVAATPFDALQPVEQRRFEAQQRRQGVGAIHDIVPAADLVHRFVEEAERALARVD